MKNIVINEGSNYLISPNGEPIAESLWNDGKDIHNSIKFYSHYLLLLKIMEPAAEWEKTREWSTYVYHDLNSALEHIGRKKKNEHRLYFLNNYGEASKFSLIRSIRRVERENDEALFIFRDENIKDIFACPATSTLLGKETDGHPIYMKSYPPTINWLIKD